MRQLDQRALHAARLASSYHEAGFVPVVDDVIVLERDLGRGCSRLARRR